MRLAIVSDIHGNLTAFEAVLADLRTTSPDLVLHGGDLADAGARPAEVVDRIRDLGWAGVVGNADEMLVCPQTLEEIASRSPALASLWTTVREMAAWTRAALGEDRLAWMRGLPLAQHHGDVALVHASPDSPWRAPLPDAADAEFEAVYGVLGRPVVIFGHVHRPYVRRIGGMTIANAGSVSLSYDGDPRASYVLLDGAEPSIRRVEYDIGREVQSLAASGLPHAAWVARLLKSGLFEMP